MSYAVYKGKRGRLPARRARGDIEINGTRVSLLWDNPMPGVSRPWFACPLCGQRCRHLYLRESRVGDAIASITRAVTCGGRRLPLAVRNGFGASWAVASCGPSLRCRPSGEAAAAITMRSLWQ